MDNLYLLYILRDIEIRNTIGIFRNSIIIPIYIIKTNIRTYAREWL